MIQRLFTELSKDEMVLIALKLDIPDAINLSLTSKDINRFLCQNDGFWIQKVTHDYDIFYDKECGITPKNFYYYIAISILQYKLDLKESVSDIMKMTRLNLSGKGLTEIPKEIGYLTKLRVLHLSHNQLKKIPKEIGNLSQLQTLYLSHNQLKKIPKKIDYLSPLLLLFPNGIRILILS